MKTKQRRNLRWFIERREPLGYTAIHGASGHWEVRDPGGRYVPKVSSTPNDRAQEYEVERLPRRREPTWTEGGPR